MDHRRNDTEKVLSGRSDRRPPGTTADPRRATPAAPDMRQLEAIAHWLDSRFRIPGTRIRFGLDSLIGLVPGLGDLATTLPAVYILYRARTMGVPRTMLARMGWNIAVDLMIGTIPLVGDVFDVGFKANRRNIALLRQHFGQPPASAVREPIQGAI